MNKTSSRISVETKADGSCEVAICPAPGLNKHADGVYSSFTGTKLIGADDYDSAKASVAAATSGSRTVHYHLWRGDEFAHFEEFPDKGTYEALLAFPSSGSDDMKSMPVVPIQGTPAPAQENTPSLPPLPSLPENKDTPAQAKKTNHRECIQVIRKSLSKEQYIGYLRGRIIHHSILAGSDSEQLFVAGWYQTALEDVLSEGGAE